MPERFAPRYQKLGECFHIRDTEPAQWTSDEWMESLGRCGPSVQDMFRIIRDLVDRFPHKEERIEKLRTESHDISGLITCYPVYLIYHSCLLPKEKYLEITQKLKN